MNQKELAKLLNVSGTTIGNWLREGLPVKKAGSRGVPADFDLEAVLLWLSDTGRGRGMRADRPGGATKVEVLTEALTETRTAVSSPPVSDPITLQFLGAEKVLDFIAGNFPMILQPFHGHPVFQAAIRFSNSLGDR